MGANLPKCLFFNHAIRQHKTRVNHAGFHFNHCNLELAVLRSSLLGTCAAFGLISKQNFLLPSESIYLLSGKSVPLAPERQPELLTTSHEFTSSTIYGKYFSC